MGLFNKKTKTEDLPTRSLADIEHLELRKQWMNAKDNLQNITEQVIIKKGAASLYPSSLAGEQAEQDLQQAEQEMLKAIDRYNSIHSILCTFITEHKQELVTTADNQMMWAYNLDANRIIEQRYSSFYKGF